MTDDRNLTKEQIDFMKKMKAVASDLWGAAPKNPPAAAQNSEDGSYDAQTVNDTRAQMPARKDALTLDNLWKTADETVDWTGALAHEQSPDGLTSPVLWCFYHRHAQRVLNGDIQAYADVLKAANPLGELTEFAESMTLRPVSAGRVECEFEAKEALTADSPKQYLAAMGLRIARDLLACLPVDEVGIRTTLHGNTIMTVTYPREKLLHRNFLFADPEKLAEECGVEMEGII